MGKEAEGRRMNPTPTRPFTPAEVAAIRAAHAAGATAVELARQYGRNHETIGRLVRGLTYTRKPTDSSHFRNLNLVDGRIRWRDLRDAALEYDECADPDHPQFETALDFVTWLKAEVRGRAA